MVKTHKDRLEELRTELEMYDARTPFELAAQVQALAMCEIADEVLEWELIRGHLGILVAHFQKYSTGQL